MIEGTPTPVAVELFVDRQMAELMVENWNRDEPDRASAVWGRADRARDVRDSGIVARLLGR